MKPFFNGRWLKKRKFATKNHNVCYMKRLLSTIITLSMALFANAQLTSALQWTGTWAAAAEYTGQGDMPKSSLSNASLRQIVRVSGVENGSANGKGVVCRLQLSNEFGSAPVEIKAVYVANAQDTSAIDAKSAKYLTFEGKRNVTIPAGKSVYCDAFHYALRPLQRLSITICYGQQVPEHATSHRGSRTTSYIMEGMVKPSQRFVAKEKVDHWYNIAKLEVEAEGGSVAVLGNSITDGRGSTTNEQNRWTDFMATALNEQPHSTGVLNLGIGGNCVVAGGLSEPALKRFDRDILGQNGVSKLIIFQGTNDIGSAPAGQSEQVAKQLTEAYQALIEKAHKAGIKTVIGATITPFKGNGWYSLFHEAARQTVNEWIRTSGAFDAVIDFDELVRDPLDKEKLRADYSEDWLHLNPKGYEAMGLFASQVIRQIDAEK